MRFAALLLVSIGCGSSPEPPSPPLSPDGGPARHEVPPGPDDPSAVLAEVAAIHGGAGPFAVAGYRMARHALQQLDAPPTGFSVEVTHHSPAAVQYSCVADGWQAATRASVGKGTLGWSEADLADLRTVVTRRDSGASLTYRLTPAFLERFTDLEMDQLRSAGDEVARLPDEAIFTATEESSSP